LTALTTSFCVDILEVQGPPLKGGRGMLKGSIFKFQSSNIQDYTEDTARKTRMKVHVVMSVLFVLVILIFRAINNRSLIDAIYTIASYTYGPLLGLFSFGLFTKRQTNDKYVPLICIVSPIICYLTNHFIYSATGYLFGYELLILNGLITFAGLWGCSRRKIPL